MISPSKQNFIETVFEILEEYAWGTIDWSDEIDGSDFRKVLSEAWDRAAKHEPVTVDEFRESVKTVVEYFKADPVAEPEWDDPLG